MNRDIETKKEKKKNKKRGEMELMSRTESIYSFLGKRMSVVVKNNQSQLAGNWCKSAFPRLRHNKKIKAKKKKNKGLFILQRQCQMANLTDF